MAAHYDADRYEEFLEHSALAVGDLVLAPVALLPLVWVRERRLGVQTRLVATVMVLRGSGTDRTVVLDVECYPDAVEVLGSHSMPRLCASRAMCGLQRYCGAFFGGVGNVHLNSNLARALCSNVSVQVGAYGHRPVGY